MLTIQEIFDKVKQHSINQPAKAETDSGSGCLYRTSTGLKCFVGALIEDKHYTKEMEGEWTGGKIVSIGLKASGIDTDNKLVERLLAMLQEVHDDHNVDEWSYRLEQIRLEFNLN